MLLMLDWVYWWNNCKCMCCCWTLSSVWTSSFSHVNTYIMLIHALLIYLVSISISKVVECRNLNARHSYSACDRKVWKIILINICNQGTTEKLLLNGYITGRAKSQGLRFFMHHFCNRHRFSARKACLFASMKRNCEECFSLGIFIIIYFYCCCRMCHVVAF